MTVKRRSPHAVILTTPSDREFRVERVFDAPIERVWATYTDPILIPEWWGQGTTVDRLELRKSLAGRDGLASASRAARSVTNARLQREPTVPGGISRASATRATGQSSM